MKTLAVFLFVGLASAQFQPPSGGGSSSGITKGHTVLGSSATVINQTAGPIYGVTPTFSAIQVNDSFSGDFSSYYQGSTLFSLMNYDISGLGSSGTITDIDLEPVVNNSTGKSMFFTSLYMGPTVHNLVTGSSYEGVIVDPELFGTNLDTFNGFRINAFDLNSGLAVDVYRAIDAELNFTNGVTVNNAYGIFVSGNGGGYHPTINNLYGASLDLSVGAAATNAYDLYLADSTLLTSSTNLWNLYSKGVTARNTFEGRVQAGAGLYSIGATFTASGCGNSTLVGGSTAGKFTSGDAGGSCSITITMGNTATASSGWACGVRDLTAPAKVWGPTTGGSTTTAVFLSPGVTTSGDVVEFSCIGY